MATTNKQQDDTDSNRPGTFKKGVSGNPNGRPRKHTAAAVIGIDNTDADIAAMKAVLDSQKDTNRKRTRKPNANPQTNKKTAEDNARTSDAIGKALETLPVFIKDNSVNQSYEGPGVKGEGLAQKTAFTPQQWEAIELLGNLITPMSVEQVAEAISVHNTTIYKWIGNPDFLEAWRQKTAEQFVQLGTIKALRVYMRELDKNTPSSRMMEQIAKSLGFFSDGSEINVQVSTGLTNAQVTILDGAEPDF